MLRRMLFGRAPVKVDFPILTSDGTGCGIEGIWCQRLGIRTFQVDNIPFAVRGISYADIVRCAWTLRGWVFESRRRSGGHGCARVYAEAGILRELWPQAIEGLDVKFEFASDRRLAVAAAAEPLRQLVARLERLPGVQVEVTAEPS
jgi:hypothetical protein